MILALSPLLTELRTNQRLRLACWLILLILCSYALLLMTDRQRLVAEEYGRLNAQAKKLAARTNRIEWQERAVAAKGIRVQLESTLFQAESRGMAQANVQSWLNSLIQKHQMSDARLQVKQAVDLSGYPDIRQVAATIEAPFYYSKFMALLYDLETDKRLLTIEQMDIVFQGKPRFTLVVKAHFQAISE